MVSISGFFRALIGTTWLFSSLLWLYIMLRIVFDGVDVHYPFIDRFPSISITMVGVGTFGLAFICMLTYLTLWGNPFARRRLGAERS